MLPARKVLVDTDPCFFGWGLDLDDGLALLFLLGSPEVEVVGVTTTYGNSFLAVTDRDARLLLARAGRKHIPVHRGAGFFHRDNRPTDASRFLAEAVRREPGELTLLTLGPLTNVAAAAASDPSFARGLRELVMMGGRAATGASEFNFRQDPAAASAVLALPCPKVEITFDICFGVAITAGDVDVLCAAKESTVSGNAARLRRFVSVQKTFRHRHGWDHGSARGGFHPWDVIAAAWLVAPGLFGGVRESSVSVDADGRSRVGPWDGSGAPVRIPATLDAGGFRTLFLDRVPRVRP